ncbi:MAG TPA: hypothetical protein VIF64_02905 [Pyrinomonadaceae bacterium]
MKLNIHWDRARLARLVALNVARRGQTRLLSKQIGLFTLFAAPIAYNPFV